jgi:hypothetical protein
MRTRPLFSKVKAAVPSRAWRRFPAREKLFVAALYRSTAAVAATWPKIRTSPPGTATATWPYLPVVIEPVGTKPLPGT